MESGPLNLEQDLVLEKKGKGRKEHYHSQQTGLSGRYDLIWSGL
jgi:hypothetical protein